MSIVPPNGVQLADNYYIDLTEITNFNWMEYRFWTETVFGKNSPEHKFTELNNHAWYTLNPNFDQFKQYYSEHPAYFNYPAVGVSQDQAIAFSEWRADRVFEFILILYEIIVWDENQTALNYFTIDKYFNGKYKDIQPDSRIEYYPWFYLPDTTELAGILHFNDSIDLINEKKFNTKKCQACFANYPRLNSSTNLDSLMFVSDQLRPVDLSCVDYKGSYILNIRGNVAEWTSVKGLAHGLGWYDNSTSTGIHHLEKVETSNAWTGFRNVSSWKKWVK